MNLARSHSNREIELRPWREADLPLLLHLRNDVGLQAKLLSSARGSDGEAVRAWLARRTASRNRLFRIIAAPADDAALGYLQAELVNDQPHTWSFGLCLAPPHQGAGRGSAALVALERTLAADYGVRRLVLDVDCENIRALRCYQRLGYHRADRPSRQVLVCGELRPVITMAKAIARDVTRS